jgi:hypothetical protein
MVIIKQALERVNKEGKTFISLELTGDVELVQSQTTGRFYATSRRCFISSTFDLPTAEKFVGTSLPGKIARVECDSYEYTVPETGEIITLGFRYEYQPEAIQPAIPKAKVILPDEMTADAILNMIE